MLRHIQCYITLLLLSTSAIAQTKIIDSLARQYRMANGRDEKLKVLALLFEESHSMNRDSLELYVKDAAGLIQPNDPLPLQTMYQLALANTYTRWGWMDSAIAVADEGLKKNTLGNAATRNSYFKFMRLKALCHGGHSNLKEALSILYQLVNEGETWHDSLSVGANLNSIGSIAVARGEPKAALEWFAKADVYTPHRKPFLANLAAINTNKANAYKMLDQLYLAEAYVNKGVALAKEVENLNTLAFARRIQSDIYMHTGKNDLAEKALQEMFQIRRLMTGGPSVIIDDNLALVDFYLNTGQVEKAIQLCKDNLKQGDLYDTLKIKGTTFTNNINVRLPFYEALAKSYKTAGSDKLYQETLEQIVAAKDSFYEMNSAQAIADMQTKYEVQKKETTIIQQKLDLVRKNNLFYGSIMLLLFLIVVSYLLFANYRKRQQLKMQQVKAEEKRISAIAVLEAEEKERRRISADLHDNLGAYANAVLYNTELLQQEQDLDERKELMNDLQYASKDIIISLRETIWALKKDTFTAEDCLLRIRNYIQPFNRYYPHIHFSVEGIAPAESSLHGSRALHLVRMVQEAVNNAIKHAGAKHIIVSSSVGAGYWKMVIEDNGKGFDNATAQHNEQHGLANLHDRANAAGITLNIQSTPGKGTLIELLIKEASLIQTQY